MELRENIKDFLKSKEISMTFSYIENDEKEDYIVSKEEITPNLSILFLKKKSENLLNDVNEMYVFTFNDDGEILHINPNSIYDIKPVIDIDWSEIHEYDIKKNITNTIQTRVESYYENNKEDFFKDFDFDKRKSATIESYFENEKIEVPEINLGLKISRELLKKYFTNRNDFFDKLEKKCIHDYKNIFRMYHINKEARKRYLEEAEKSGSIEQIKKNILDLYKDDAYKTLTYTLELPNGTEITEKDVNNGWGEFNRQKSHINDGYVTLECKDYPLSSIKSITWKRKNLYEKNFEIDNEKLIEDFVSVKNYYEFPKEYYEEKSFVFDICKKDPKALTLFSFKNDEDFCYELLDFFKNSPKNIPFIIDNMCETSLFENFDYLNKILDFMVENNIEFTGYKISVLFDKIDFDAIDSIDFFKKIFNLSKSEIIKGMMIELSLNKMDKDFINSKIIKDNINLFKNHYTLAEYRKRFSSYHIDLIEKICDVKILTELFDNDTLLAYIGHINSDLLDCKEFILDLCKNHSDDINIFFEDLKPVLEIHKNDILIINELAKFIGEYDINKFFYAIDIKPITISYELFDKDESLLSDFEKNKKEEQESFIEVLYEFADLNINFLKPLKFVPQKQEIFLIGNLLSFNHIEFDNEKDILCLKGDFYTAEFKLPYNSLSINYYDATSLTYYDANKKCIEITNSEILQNLLSEIHEEMLERYPELKKLPENDKTIWNFSNFVRKINPYINKDEPEIF